MKRTFAAAVITALFLYGAPSQASPLTAGGNHSRESHVGEDHSAEMLAGIDISKANFTLANLSGTVLTDAAAEKAIFTGALLVGADLSGAELAKAVFTGANLTGAALLDVAAEKAIFTDSVLIGADLSGAELSNAAFTRADLTDAVMTGANLETADLRDAVLDDADLCGSRVDNADFTGASLVGVDLSCLLSAEHAIWTNALYDDTTAMAPGFDASMMIFLPEPSSQLGLVVGIGALACLRPRRARRPA